MCSKDFRDAVHHGDQYAASTRNGSNLTQAKIISADQRPKPRCSRHNSPPCFQHERGVVYTKVEWTGGYSFLLIYKCFFWFLLIVLFFFHIYPC